nr:cysteine peptidase family C39 domain-containing protein [Marinomonas sp. IMCC 4694]
MSDSDRSEQSSSSPLDNDAKSEHDIANESGEGSSSRIEEEVEMSGRQWNIKGASLEYPNPLLDCLVLLSKYFYNPHTADGISAGLPITDNAMSPELFKRAAQRIGINARFVKRSLVKIPNMVMPVVLLLNDQQACVLLEFDKAKGKAKILRPESGEGEIEVTTGDLIDSFTGYCFFVRPLYKFDKRSEKKNENEGKKGHWFWGTISRSWRIYRDVFIASLLINIFAVASPLFVMNVYDRVVPNNAFDTLWVLAIGAGVVYLFDFLLRTLRAYFIDIAGKKIRYFDLCRYFFSCE